MEIGFPSARDVLATRRPCRTRLATAACVVLAAVALTGNAAAADRVREGNAHHDARAALAAEAFLAKVITLLAANDYAAAWTSLYPAQQRLVPRTAYVRCEASSPIPGRLGRLDVLDAHVERIVVPGTRAPARRSTAVTFRITLVPLGPGRPAVVTVRAHALRADRRWTWMLPAGRLALHRSGRCGAAPAPVGPPA